MPADLSPAWCVAVPLLGAIAIAIAGWGATEERPARQNLREAITLATAAALLWLVTRFYDRAMAGPDTIYEVLEFVPGMPMAFHVEPLGMIYALVASSLWILNSLYSIGYMRGNNEEHQTRFYICFAVALSAAVGSGFMWVQQADMSIDLAFFPSLDLPNWVTPWIDEPRHPLVHRREFG